VDINIKLIWVHLFYVREKKSSRKRKKNYGTSSSSWSVSAWSSLAGASLQVALQFNFFFCNPKKKNMKKQTNKTKRKAHVYCVPVGLRASPRRLFNQAFVFALYPTV